MSSMMDEPPTRASGSTSMSEPSLTSARSSTPRRTICLGMCRRALRAAARTSAEVMSFTANTAVRRGSDETQRSRRSALAAAFSPLRLRKTAQRMPASPQRPRKTATRSSLHRSSPALETAAQHGGRVEESSRKAQRATEALSQATIGKPGQSILSCASSQTVGVSPKSDGGRGVSITVAPTMQPSGWRRARNAATASGRDSFGEKVATRHPRVCAKRLTPATLRWQPHPPQ